MRNDKRQSQKMMRMRVAFQLSTIGALVGGIYWRAYKSMTGDEEATKFLQRSGELQPQVDNRVFLRDPTKFDLTPEELEAKAAAEASSNGEAAATSTAAARGAGSSSGSRALA